MNKKSVLLAILISATSLILLISLMRGFPDIVSVKANNDLEMAQDIRRLDTTSKIYKYLNDMEKIVNYKNTFIAFYSVLYFLIISAICLNVIFIGLFLAILTSGELKE